MHVSGVPDQRFGGRRRVYYPSARWRVFAFVFPVFGLGALYWLVRLVWNDAIWSGDVSPIAYALASGLIFATLCFWIFANLWRGTRLIVSAGGIVYQSWGFSLRTTWDNVAAVDEMLMGASTQRGLRLREPSMRANWLIKYGMVRSAQRGRSNPDQISRFIPLSFFRPNWESEPLGEIIRRCAPQAFGGEPLAVIDGAMAPAPPITSVARLVVGWAVFSFVVVLEIVGAIMVLLYAGSQALQSQSLDEGYGLGALAFSPDSNTLASEAGSGIQLWNVSDGVLRHSSAGGYEGVAFSLADSTLISVAVQQVDSNKKASVAILSSTNGTVLRRIPQPDNADVDSIFRTPDGTFIGEASQGGAVRVWQAASGALKYTIATDSHGYDPNPEAVMAGNGDTMIVESGDGKPYEYRLRDGKLLGAFNTGVDFVFVMASTPNGKTLALGGLNGGVEVVNADGTLVRSIDTDKSADKLTLSPDGRFVAAGFEDGRVQLWSVRDGALLCTLSAGQSDQVSAIAISPNDRALAAGAGGVTPMYLWDISHLTS
jgi:Anaphase-promoting complex subunit 4 WD40 domain